MLDTASYDSMRPPRAWSNPNLALVWRALTAAPLSEERAKADKSGTTEGPFLACFQPLTLSLVRTKNNLQRIDLPNKRVENLAEFMVAGRINGFLNIIGRADTVTPNVRAVGKKVGRQLMLTAQ